MRECNCAAEREIKGRYRPDLGVVEYDVAAMDRRQRRLDLPDLHQQCHRAADRVRTFVSRRNMTLAEAFIFCLIRLLGRDDFAKHVQDVLELSDEDLLAARECIFSKYPEDFFFLPGDDSLDWRNADLADAP